MEKDRDVRREIFDGFNEFINKQNAEPPEVCMFIYSLLSENNFDYYHPTGCYGDEWKLKADDWDDED